MGVDGGVQGIKVLVKRVPGPGHHVRGITETLGPDADRILIGFRHIALEVRNHIHGQGGHARPQKSDQRGACSHLSGYLAVFDLPHEKRFRLWSGA